MIGMRDDLLSFHQKIRIPQVVTVDNHIPF